MPFCVTDQLIFAVDCLWQAIRGQLGFAIVTCDPNKLVACARLRAMIAILAGADWDWSLTRSFA